MTENFSVGEYLIDFSRIYQITAIKAPLVYFQPLPGSDKVFTASIPLCNLKKAGIRRVLTSPQIKQIMAGLKTLVVKSEYNSLTAKEELYRNEPKNIIFVLLYFWERFSQLAKTDRNLAEQILEHLSQEFSLVTGKKYLETKRDITKILDQRGQKPLSVD